MTSKVPDVLFKLLTQHQELVQFGNVEEVFCVTSISGVICTTGMCFYPAGWSAHHCH